jgi:hypothetical protein
MQKSEKLEKFLGLVSNYKSGLLEKIQWRQSNEEWRERSGKIALKVLRKLRENKNKEQLPSSQKEFSRTVKH